MSGEYNRVQHTKHSYDNTSENVELLVQVRVFRTWSKTLAAQPKGNSECKPMVINLVHYT
jgi:hypothetical protein